ncbi:MAG: endonuclease domain-containing protein [Usitatibacter sp.]
MSRHSHLAPLRRLDTAERAKRLRSGMTDAEKLLWYHLRGGRLQGWKFRRQVPLGPYIADFLCEEAWLIVEVDGGQHADQVDRDEERTAWLRARGYSVVRYWNNEVLKNLEGVLATLSPALSQGRGRTRDPPPGSLRTRRVRHHDAVRKASCAMPSRPKTP